MFCAGADLEIGLEREDGVNEKEHRDGYVIPFPSHILISGQEIYV